MTLVESFWSWCFKYCKNLQISCTFFPKIVTRNWGSGLSAGTFEQGVVYVEIFTPDLMPLDFGFLLISFKKTFFPKIWAAKFRVWLICGCSLSTDAAYLQSLRYQPSLKNKNKKTLSDKGLTLIVSAFKTCYGGQFTWSTQLMKSNYLVSHPTNAAPQVLQECTSIIIIFIYLLAYYLHTIIISFINVLMLFRFYYYTSIFL